MTKLDVNASTGGAQLSCLRDGARMKSINAVKVDVRPKT